MPVIYTLTLWFVMSDKIVAPVVHDERDPLFEYARWLGDKRYPDCDVDENGETMFFPSIVPCDFLKQYPKLKYPFTYADYLEKLDILATIEGFGLDRDKFWYAIVFIYYLTIEKFTDSILSDQSAIGQMRLLHEYLSGHDVSITVKKRGKGKSKKTATVTNELAIETLRDILADKIEAVKDNLFYQSVNIGIADRKTYSNTLMMGFMAELFLELFHLLELRGKRAKHTINKGYTDETSYERLLLISRIIYFVRLTDNTSFMFGSDSLSGILARCAKDNPTFETGITRKLIPI
jgi:hypothetical protein